mmetsp:Transcript_4956/g.19834  ORF Transcript_4956/g.19834 Transcript_4956/m.19834 type:complete len:312 (-) Transcript_4956:75-1010(-)|eukprot:scaffold301_cov243-Pinguiococcus_pyrenoidosus.AAC.139
MANPQAPAEGPARSSARESALQLVGEFGVSLAVLPPVWQHDKEVVLQAVRQDPRSLRCAAPALKGDPEVVLEAVRGVPKLLSLPQKPWEKEQGAVARRGSARLQRVPPRVRKSLVLQRAMEVLSQDPSVGHLAEQTGSEFLGGVAEELFADRSFMVCAVQLHGLLLHLAPAELKNDRELVLLAVSQNGMSLRSASESLRSDRDVVLAAVASCGAAILFAERPARFDRDIVRVAVEGLPHAGPDLIKEILGGPLAYRVQEWHRSEHPGEDDLSLQEVYAMFIAFPMLEAAKDPWVRDGVGWYFREQLDGPEN